VAVRSLKRQVLPCNGWSAILRFKWVLTDHPVKQSEHAPALHGFAVSLETVTVIEARVILAHEVWKKKLQRSPSLLLLGLLWLGLPWVIPETFDQSDLDAFPRVVYLIGKLSPAQLFH